MPKERKLTPKQQKFVDYYIIEGNATQAYIKAGYGNDNQSYSRKSDEANALKMRPAVAAEIARRTAEEAKIHAENVASGREVMAYFTAVMRGELKDQFGLDASLSDRTRAAQELARRTVDIENRKAGVADSQVTIKLDWNRS